MLCWIQWKGEVQKKEGPGLLSRIYSLDEWMDEWDKQVKWWTASSSKKASGSSEAGRCEETL